MIPEPTYSAAFHLEVDTETTALLSPVAEYRAVPEKRGAGS